MTPGLRAVLPGCHGQRGDQDRPAADPRPRRVRGRGKDLIASATRTLYLQFQYIEPPRAGVTTARPFLDLIGAVIDRQRHGVEVKIIMSEFETAGYLEQLQGMGLDVVSNVKIQQNMHNKGRRGRRHGPGQQPELVRGRDTRA